MGLTLVTPPPGEPITLAEAKAHLRVDGSQEDTLILALMRAARESAESVTGRKLVEQVWDWTLDAFPVALRLPLAPVRSIISISYRDTAGASQTLPSALYQTDLAAEPGLILPVFGQVWPQTQPALNAVTVRLAAGYAAGAGGDYGANVPAAIKAAMLLLVGHLFAHREAVGPVQLATVPMATEHLLLPYKIWGF